MPHDQLMWRRRDRDGASRPARLGARQPIFVSTASRPAPALIAAIVVAFLAVAGLGSALLLTGDRALSWPAAAAALAAAGLGSAGLRRWPTRQMDARRGRHGGQASASTKGNRVGGRRWKRRRF